MRKLVMSVLAVGLLAACGQQDAKNADAPTVEAAPQATGVNVIERVRPEQWSVRDASFQNGAFVVARNGTVAVSNPQHAVHAGETWLASITLEAQSAGSLQLHLTNGCRTEGVDRTVVGYDVQPGANTLNVAHVFVRDSGCARFTVSSPDSSMTFAVASANISKIS